MPLTVIAKFKANPGTEAEVNAALVGMTGPSRAEAGCLNYDIYQSTQDPAVLFTYENWTDKAALNRHMETPHFKALGERLTPLLAAPMTIDQLMMTSDQDAPASGDGSLADMLGNSGRAEDTEMERPGA